MSHRTLFAVFLGLSLTAGLYACSGDDNATTDGGADVNVPDASKDVSVLPDSGGDATLTDGGSDATSDASDGGLNSTSLQIQAVRDAADQTANVADGGDAGDAGDASDDGGDAGSLNLPVDHAIVTYVHAAIGNDVAGFFVQAEKTGPALFVAVDPSTLNPLPVAGDDVSFVVDSVGLVGTLREATAISSFARNAQNQPLSALLQDLSSATDVVNALDSYESEYVTMKGTIAADFAYAGSGFVSAQLDTAGVSGNANMKLRLPATVQSSVDVGKGCSLTLTGAMWRYNTQAQPSGWVESDLNGITCPAPKVVSAVATSATSVVVTFDRNLDAVTVTGDGSQFSFDNGLTASAASLTAPKEVTVTTSTQTASTTYTVTVAGTLKDMLGTGVDQAANTATFTGYVKIAVLRLNEVNPNIGGSKDLIELRVITDGNLNGIDIYQDPGANSNNKILATLPDLDVAVDDLIVVHLNDGNVTSETTTKTDCTDAACYSGAWDIAGGSSGIVYAGTALAVRNPDTTIQDAVAFSKGSGSAGYFLDTLTFLQSAGQWLPADCGGQTCTFNTTPSADDITANWSSVGNSATGDSIGRVKSSDNDDQNDWAVGTSTFGAANP